MGSFDFAIKLKITPKNFVPSIGTIYRATLLISLNTASLEGPHFLKKKALKGHDKLYVLAFCMQIFLLFCSSSNNHFLFGLKTLANSNKYCKKKVSLKNFYLEILGSQG